MSEARSLRLELPLSDADKETLDALRRQCPFARDFLERLLGVVAAAHNYGVSGEALGWATQRFIAGPQSQIQRARKLPPLGEEPELAP